MGGKSQETTTDTNTQASPWSGVAPYLRQAYRQASNIYGQGVPEYYPGQTVANQSQQTQQAIDLQTGRALTGSSLNPAAQGQVTDTLAGAYFNPMLQQDSDAALRGIVSGEGTAPQYQGISQGVLGSMGLFGGPLANDITGELRNVIGGGYLNAEANPYLQSAINTATRPVIEQYTDTVLPGIDSSFSSAGRTGSGAHALATGKAAAGLQATIGDIGSNMAFGNYNAERGRQTQGITQGQAGIGQEASTGLQGYGLLGNLFQGQTGQQLQGIGLQEQAANAERERQMRAAGLAPDLAREDYYDIGQLATAGDVQNLYNQALIDADIARYNYGQTAPMDYLSQYLGLLNTAPWGQNSTSTQTGPASNPLTGGIGGALGGLGTAGLLGLEMSNPFTAGLGLLGAAGGAFG